MKKPLNPTLTTVEVAVARHIALGLPRKSVATKLRLSCKTVEYHVDRIRRKVGVDSDEQLVRWAVESRLVSPGEKLVDKEPVDLLKIPDLRCADDLADAILKAAGLAAAQTCDPLQVNALCQCTEQLVNLARFHMDAMERPAAQRVKWLWGSSPPRALPPAE
jgi:DNA-binding CsgD family transcriptional regulator